MSSSTRRSSLPFPFPSLPFPFPPIFTTTGGYAVFKPLSLGHGRVPAAPEPTRALPLLRADRAELNVNEALLLDFPPVTMLNFFDGRWQDAHAYLKERMGLTLVANPWLGGHIARDAETKKLFVDFSIQNEFSIDEFVVVAESLKIHDSMPVVEMGKLIRKSGAILSTGSELVKKRLPFVRITISPDAEMPDSRFIMVFSINHAIADGHTAYELFSGLSSGNSITVMNPHKRENAPALMKEAVGEKTDKYMTNPALLLSVIGGGMLGYSAKITALFVDEKKVQQLKEAAKSDSATGFVSTNDIITSHFGNAVSSRPLT
jgi:hypothetical protein